MKTGTWITRISSFPVVGLLVLAGVVSGAQTAAAQTQEACPLPAGGTPPADPLVTAQQVEDGSASLMDFALAVRDQFSRGTASAEQALYVGCRVRQEGSPWRSGSTYLVQLTPDGRVFVHAKDMSLSGRLLNPSIYIAILQALGIGPADLADPLAAFATAIAGNGGTFNVPHVPGASGYAAAYFSANFRSPIVVLAGFDLTDSHLVSVDVETIDFGDPTISARDVVDRETLKAFVTQAGEFVLAQQESGDPAAASKLRIALRDPNGPWRRGSVYLYVLNLTNPEVDPPEGVIFFHGAFPDRYELRPLAATIRDIVTGELILPQVINAATSNPEGGFIQYYFDDPTDDADSADIPKVGYARQFTGELSVGGRVIPLNFIVGSGFYLSSPEVVAARQTTIVESVLPQVMRAMSASTVDAVSDRIRQASSGTPPANGFSLGGASTLSDALLAHGDALQSGTLDLDRLLAGSSFTTPLSAADTGGSGPLGNLTLWGSGDYRNFSGGNAQTVDYDGDVASASLGIDTRLDADLLAGMSVARARGTVDYTDSYALTGELTTTLTSISPYVGWQAPGGMNLWAAAGYGWGEVEIDDESADPQASDLTQQMVAGGVNGTLASSDRMIAGGTTSLRLKAETAFTWADVDGSGTLRSTTLNTSRQRLMLEGVHAQELASGATFSPSLELGLRHDGGDGETGSSLEVGGGLRYADPATGLTFEGRARTLLVPSGDYEEWGVSGLVRIDPGTGGRGLALSVQPAWGRTASGVQRSWETDAIGGATPADQALGRVSARIDYGIGAAWMGRGVLTPYTEVSLSGEGSRRLSLGGRFDIGPSVRMSLEGVHSRPAHGATDHGIMLRSDLNW